MDNGSSEAGFGNRSRYVYFVAIISALGDCYSATIRE